MSSHNLPVDAPAPLLDPARAAERLHAASEVVAEALNHVDATLTVAEAELVIARYRHVHRTAHSTATG